MGGYAPLHAWLVGQPSNLDKIHARFEQIEGILGFILPATARKKSQWWENNATRHVQARAWLDAGFHTANLSLSNGTVDFERR